MSWSYTLPFGKEDVIQCADAKHLARLLQDNGSSISRFQGIEYIVKLIEKSERPLSLQTKEQILKIMDLSQ